jgi:ATPase subunit of ABC transporter with duplicated ATPase domains
MKGQVFNLLSTSGVELRFGSRKLFDDVSIQFNHGNCYGVIGANGSGKSSFLKILSGELEPNHGNVSIGPNERIAVLKQDHFEFDEFEVLQTVIMGHKKLYDIMVARDAIYSKPEMTDEDGMEAAHLESDFADLNGWEAEYEAAVILTGLSIPESLHRVKMKELTGSEKVKILLAQALFGHPDILLLDEPTNHLDIKSIRWLENFLMDFEKTVIVVSHDRHFLNKICTQMVDIDFGKATLFMGNYDFWYESSQLALAMARDKNKKTEEKMKELQDFIARFSANASKSKQATSRKKMLDKLSLDDIKPSSRKYPFINFKPDREIGNEVLTVEGLTKTYEGRKVLDNVSFRMNKDDKIALVGDDEVAKSVLLSILAGEMEPDSGTFKWGVTITPSYFPKNNTPYFEGCDLSLVDWLRQYSVDQDETFVRGFLGRMLFSGEEALKKANVLSGGEKVRCMLSRMMLSGANVLLLDEPTGHLDLESITAENNGLIDFSGNVILISHDLQFVNTIANRIIEITPKGIMDRAMTYEEYLENDEVQEKLSEMYS